jgi:hypothetical protein
MDRSRASSACAGVSPGSSSSCLIATVRCRRSSCACHTMPIAPLPRRAPSR